MKNSLCAAGSGWTEAIFLLSYYKKLHQAWFIYEDSAAYGYGTKLEIGDCQSTALYYVPDIKQEEER